mmetsp:Transcript_10004/g.29056  ORF Transcript_10004/g.29056 Transcript_10004/m.29056 type:complete len:255 (-) Transcript_10004:399-1163(-)
MLIPCRDGALLRDCENRRIRAMKQPPSILPAGLDLARERHLQLCQVLPISHNDEHGRLHHLQHHVPVGVEHLLGQGTHNVSYTQKVHETVGEKHNLLQNDHDHLEADTTDIVVSLEHDVDLVPDRGEVCHEGEDHQGPAESRIGGHLGDPTGQDVGPSDKQVREQAAREHGERLLAREGIVVDRQQGRHRHAPLQVPHRVARAHGPERPQVHMHDAPVEVRHGGVARHLHAVLEDHKVGHLRAVQLQLSRTIPR